VDTVEATLLAYYYILLCNLRNKTLIPVFYRRIKYRYEVGCVC